jgi:hypothetical protein
MSSSTNQSAETFIANGLTYNLSDVDIASPKLNKSGGKAANLLYKPTKKALYLNLQVPMLTWGAQMFKDTQSGKETFDLAIQFPRSDYSTPETDILLSKFQALENYIKSEAIRNSMAWFNKKTMTAEVIEALWTPMLKYSKDPSTGEPDMTKAPTLKVKLPLWDGKFQCEIYDTNGSMLYPDAKSPNTPVDLITKGMNIVAIIQCGGLWFANGKFGCTWRLFQTVVQPKPSLKGRCLIACSPAVKQALVTASAAGPSNDETGLTIEEDSDCEAEPEVEEAPAPVAVAVAKPAPVAVAAVKVKAKAAPAPAPVPEAEPEPTVEEAAPLPVAAPAPVPAAAAAVVKKKVIRKKE